jgi:hypothetical protein
LVLRAYSGLATPVAVLKKKALEKIPASARISTSLRMMVDGSEALFWWTWSGSN